jgi:NAD kinase
MEKVVKTLDMENMVTCNILGKDYYINSENFVNEVTKATRNAGILSDFKVYVNGNLIGEKQASSMKVLPSDKVYVQPYDEAGC